MAYPAREEALKQIEKDAEIYRAQRDAAIREFATNLTKERAILDEAEREHGQQFSEEIKQARANFDKAEREFYESAEEALKAFNAAIEEARRAIG